MSLRWKLVLSYIVMGALPILIVVFAAVIAFVNLAASSPFIKSFGSNSIQTLFTDSDYLVSVERTLRENPARFTQTSELKRLDQTLQPFKAGLLYTDAQDRLGYASKNLNGPELLVKINTAKKDRSTWDEDSKKGMGGRFVSADPTYHVVLNNSAYTVLERPLQQGKLGRLYIPMDIGPIGDALGNYFKGMFRIAIIPIVIIILLLTFLVSRSMLRSLGQLRLGVDRITEGNLDFQLEARGRDEVAGVIRSFEQMRQHLKTSIDQQLLYEENRKELMANISHDLKTPVTSIKGYVEGLLDGVADTPEKKERYLHTVLQKTLVLDRMIDDLFLFSKLDLGKLPFHLEHVDAAQFVRDLCAEARLDLTERGFDVVCQIDVPDGLRVTMDRLMVRRVQSNLTENAVKYCKGEVKRFIFRAYIYGDELIISAEDNGVGIALDEQQKVFDGFYRSGAARSSETGGTGLGLQIAHQIVAEHGGRIWIESELEQYTRVSYTLPLKSTEQSTSEREG